MMGAHLSFEKGLEFYQSCLVFQLAARNMMGKPAGLRGKFHYLFKLESRLNLKEKPHFQAFKLQLDK